MSQEENTESKNENQEFVAMKAIDRWLSRLPPDAQARVMQYHMSKAQAAAIHAVASDKKDSDKQESIF